MQLPARIVVLWPCTEELCPPGASKAACSAVIAATLSNKNGRQCAETTPERAAPGMVAATKLLIRNTATPSHGQILNRQISQRQANESARLPSDVDRHVFLVGRQR